MALVSGYASMMGPLNIEFCGRTAGRYNGPPVEMVASLGRLNYSRVARGLRALGRAFLTVLSLTFSRPPSSVIHTEGAVASSDCPTAVPRYCAEPVPWNFRQIA